MGERWGFGETALLAVLATVYFADPGPSHRRRPHEKAVCSSLGVPRIPIGPICGASLSPLEQAAPRTYEGLAQRGIWGSDWVRRICDFCGRVHSTPIARP